MPRRKTAESVTVEPEPAPDSVVVGRKRKAEPASVVVEAEGELDNDGQDWFLFFAYKLVCRLHLLLFRVQFPRRAEGPRRL